MNRRLSILLVTMLAVSAMAAPRIVFEEFHVEPAALKLGEAIVVRAKVRCDRVALGSFLLRTAEEVKKADAPPGFGLHANGFAYVAGDGKYHLKDNGKLDRDPRDGAFAIEIATRGWKQGRRVFAFFASNRPAAGPFVAARHDFAVTVAGERVTVEDLGNAGFDVSRAITSFRVEQTTGAGLIEAKVRGTTARRLQLANPLYIAERETLPGFRYDAAKKKSFLDVPLADGCASLKLDTTGWPAGVHLLAANVLNSSGRVVDYRNFAIAVRGPRDRLRVTVEPSSAFTDGTHFGRFVQLRDGTLLSEEKFSADAGRAWQGGTGGFGCGAQQLRDGRVLGLAYRCLPVAGREGWYAADRFLSTDNGRHFTKAKAEFHVPEAKGAQGHAFHPGPLFMRSIVERADGSLVALMAGWFKSDTALCPYGRGRPYSRSYVCESSDGGATWRFLATIGYAQVGSEGFNEGAMRRLPDGTWLAVLRTGNANDLNCQDNPIMWSHSRDEGRTWTAPARTGLNGAYPGLAVLPDGLVAMSYGRPGAMVAFSADGGRTWTDPTCVDATPGSGYTDVAGVGPGELLVGFGAQSWLDEKTGERASQLRLARVRYEPAR